MQPSRVIAIAGGAGALALVFSLSTAGLLSSGPTRSVVSTGPDGLRTFTVARVGDQPILCTLGKSIPELGGVLQGQAGAPDPIWLVADDGRTMIFVWPAGFSARFSPDAELLDDQGRSVAKAGERVTLGQVHIGSAAGTHEDPYIASGLVFDGCYAYVP
jgi:hypothetical protein